MVRYFEARARGGAGLVIIEIAGVVWPAGCANPSQLGISDDRFLPGLARLADAIRAHGAKAAIQLQHAGRVATRDIAAGRPLLVPSQPPPFAADLYHDLAPEDVRAATADYMRPGAKLHYRVATDEDLAAVPGWFAEAAARAQRAGFDGVELHAGHGYLFSAFLSPKSNRREDGYGGDLAGRARLLLETIRAVRARVGRTLALWMRFDGAELGVDGGIGEEDARETAALAEAAGLDAVHVSAYADPGSGAAFTRAPLVHARGGFADLARGVKSRVGIPVIAVGRLDPEEADELLHEGGADFVAMGRGLLADPDLPRKLAERARGAVRPCIYSYRCVGNVFLTKHVQCTVNPSTGREHAWPEAPAPAPRRRRVLVAGGGPAGLEVARLAAERGHAVVLCEAQRRLGGLALAAGLLDPAIGDLLAWLEGRVRALDVEIVLGKPVDAAALAGLAPDAVVVATGARRAAPELPGGERVLRLDGLEDALREGALARGAVAILGGGSIGLDLAARLVREGRAVTVLEPGRRFGAPMAPPRLWRTLAHLRRDGVALLAGMRPVAFEPGALRYADARGVERVLACEHVVAADLGRADDALAASLAASGPPVYRVGDGAGPGYLEHAFLQARHVAEAIAL
jgi:2,4-dienoyl-CoA reductase (NADPH2)